MSESLPDRLKAGIQALRNGRAAEAVQALEPVARDPELSRHPDLQDVRARVCSLLAQALLEVGRAGDARQWAATALRILRQHPDSLGQQEVRELQERIEAAAGAATAPDPILAAMVRSRTADELVVDVDDPARRSDLLNRKANQHLDDGEVELGERVARRALEEGERSGAPRGPVLALLTLARARPEQASEHLHAAWRIADAADEFVLVGTVAQTATLHGLTLETRE